ncbi:predicted protein [Uncinocarpus reesii 1704]|uniref:Uncharacterized protein n=1 Tax=Uncinocarpus reesii (strain UAMH 1704) TaxID=336963 RepID=C4JUV3_UNCRE|nr:uncharacterized protein UREG_04906 [Uncinocarpus reesii 1704]EEP80064.1 predicted protein [Uncinocarpus reesii 1704]
MGNQLGPGCHPLTVFHSIIITGCYQINAPSNLQASRSRSVIFESPIFESPLFESPLFESPLFESPLFESPLFESPLFESPLFESPLFESPLFKWFELFQIFRAAKLLRVNSDAAIRRA